jgi:hypothetical protein
MQLFALLLVVEYLRMINSCATFVYFIKVASTSCIMTIISDTDFKTQKSQFKYHTKMIFVTA